MDLALINQASSLVDYLAFYHRYKVVGMEHVPTEGSCLLVCNHSLATYDILLLTNQIFKETKRVPRALMDRWFFKLEKIGALMKSMGAVQGDPKASKDLLAKGHIVCVAPGGMRESIRSSNEKYQIIWDKRKGFAKLAISAQAPVILAACPKADDIYDILPTGALSMFFYKTFKVPFAIIKGFGFTPIPKPVELIHFLSEPLLPPKLKEGEEITQKMIDQFHAKLVKRMRDLMGQALTYRPPEND